MPEIYADSIEAKVDGTNQIVPIRDITKAPAIIASASGESIQLSDSGDAPLTDIKLYGKSKQDGEPSPDNPVEIEIPGSDGNVEIEVTGANLFDNDSKDIEQGAFASDSGLPTANAANRVRVINMTHVQPGEYTINIENTDGKQKQVNVWVYDLDGTFLKNENMSKYQNSPATFTITGNRNIRFGVSNADQSNITPSDVGDIMLNKGSSALPYEPYKRTSATLPTPNGLPGIPVASGGNYTDADGQQWICDEIDYARGKYVQRVGVDNLRNCVWIDSWNSAYNIDGTFLVYTQKYNNIVSSDRWYNVKCSHFKNFSGSILSDPNAGMGFGEGSMFNAAFRVPTTLASNIDEWEDWIQQNNITFMLILATPVETDLTTEQLTALKQLRTYQTVTNITTDTEPQVGMEVEYTADTKTYIDNKFAELAQSLAATQNTLLQEV